MSISSTLNKLASFSFKIKESTFLNTRIDGGNSLESVGNFFLTPAQYLMNGKKVTLIQNSPSKTSYLFNYKNEGRVKEVLKLAVAIIALFPATIIGCAFKSLAFMGTTTRNHHRAFNAEFYPKTVTPQKTDYSEIASKLTCDELAPCLGHQVDQASKEKHKPDVEALKVVKEIFEKHGIAWWIDCGTALGAYRYGSIIPWDYDVDISILKKDHHKVFKILNAELDPNKYDIQNWSSYKEPDGLLKLYIKESDMRMDIYHYDVDPSKKTVTYCWGHDDCIFVSEWEKAAERPMTKPVPFSQMFPLKKTKIDGLEVPVPNDTKAFLQSRYGENLDPVRIWNEEKQAYVKVKDHPYWDDHVR